MADKLTPERSVRLLRAKAAELEAQVRNASIHEDGVALRVTYLTADIALIAGLLADYIDHNETAVAKAAKTAGRAVWPGGKNAPGPGQPGDASDAT